MRWLLLFVPLAIAGCTCGSACDGALCGPCPTPITIDVTLSGIDAPVVVSGDDAGITCAASASGGWRCQSSTAAPGTYHVVVSAAGHVDAELDITLTEPSPSVCCACPGIFERAVTLSHPDIPGDAGGPDASASDAGERDADLDATPVDAGTCDPSAVRFLPPGGTLEEGTLCDDVFVCLDAEADGALVMAASGVFTCSSVPDGTCPGATCRYADPGGPSTLDANEIAEICAVTVALPSPDLVCMVYL